MKRINESDLETAIARLNEITNSPEKPYSTDGANLDNYHLSCAYGGYALHRMTSNHGAIRDIFGGHVPKRELHGLIQAFISGMSDQ